MKRVITIMAILFSAAQIFASELIVKGKIDVPFSVFINGEKYYSYNSQVNISNIPRGYYNMQIYTEGASYELLYDCRIEIQRNEIVTASFTGDNTIYISSTRVATPVILDVTPYPYRVVPAHVHHHVAPAPKPTRVYHSKPKNTPGHGHTTNNKPRPTNDKARSNENHNSSGDSGTHYGPRQTTNTRK